MHPPIVDFSEKPKPCVSVYPHDLPPATQIRFVAAQVAVESMGKSSGASSSDADPRRIDDAHGVYIETSPRSYVLVEKKYGEGKSPQARSTRVDAYLAIIRILRCNGGLVG